MKNIVQQARIFEFKHISLEDVGTCLFIRIYPGFDEEKYKSSNYKEGVTNTIMSFLGGLINHRLEIKGLNLHVDRRQSFGFLRASLADIDSLRFRLSFGFEPDVFHEVLLESFGFLDQILDVCDFRDEKNYYLSSFFMPVEKPKTKDGRPTENTGTALRKTMRSEEKQWLSFNDAKEFLDESYNPTDLNYILDAFQIYLNSIVYLSSLDIPNKTGKYLSEKLKKYTKEIAKQDSSTNGQTQGSIFLELLANIIDYSIFFIRNRSPIDKNTPFLFSLHHSIEKLFNNCQKGMCIILHAEKLEVTHLFLKASLLIENML